MLAKPFFTSQKKHDGRVVKGFQAAPATAGKRLD